MLVASTIHAAPAETPPETSAQPAPKATVGMDQIGPDWNPERALWADADARMRVRGDRPEGASIHVAYATPDRRWDEALRHELALFESTAFPEGQAPRKTIVDEPPEEWMRKLKLPELSVRWSDATITYLRYFRDDPKGKALIRGWIRRMGRYEGRLRAILREVGVPEDLVFVAMAESGFIPQRRSKVGAAGMWQFMEPTGRVYGLGSEYWIDDRLDFEKASYAAATYLADLEARFGTWELALAAYNGGYGLVVQSIRANNTNNFWALTEIENGLPRQTANYVPKFLAAAIVGHNREVFTVDGKAEANLELIEVKVAAGTRLEDLAKAIDADEDLIAEINANYLRGRVPPEGGPAPVRIPRDKHERFATLGGELRSDEQRWTIHQVALGEDLERIAAAYGITEKQLRSINGIHDSGEVKGGVKLVVPAGNPSANNQTPAPTVAPLVAVPPLTVPAGKRLLFFRVTRASSSAAIATGFSVAWEQIVAWNDLDPHARLVDGQILQILVATDFDPAAAGLAAYELSEVRHVIRGTTAHLDAVLETLEYLATQTSVWLEITTLLIPGHNDGDAEIRAQCEWILEHLGPTVPLHFSAFHPDFKMLDVPATPPATLSRARRIAKDTGLAHVYTGNVHDIAGDTTACASCG
ncbi:MAG: transglycosylase SLT domain-containing protein, partial [Myxococcales bacterium]|nr:transglycosylase SLT domain-containing protein [Myxococcales bacterium]